VGGPIAVAGFTHGSQRALLLPAHATAPLRAIWGRGSERRAERHRACRAATWFGKPPALSPIACAAHGWTNTAADTLKCPFCNATVAFQSSLHGTDAAAAADAFLERLASAHDACCPWRAAAPSSAALVAFPPASQPLVCAAFVRRVARLATLAASPALGGNGIAALLEGAAAAQLTALLHADCVPVREVRGQAFWVRGWGGRVAGQGLSLEG